MDLKYQLALDRLNSFKKLYGDQIVKIIGKANHYIFINLTDAMVAGVPQPANINEKKIWSVPIVLTSRATAPTEIGVIFIDDKTQEVIGATDTPTVMQNAEALIYEIAEVA